MSLLPGPSVHSQTCAFSACSVTGVVTPCVPAHGPREARVVERRRGSWSPPRSAPSSVRACQEAAATRLGNLFASLQALNVVFEKIPENESADVCRSIAVNVLDCDTIGQAKEKIFQAFLSKNGSPYGLQLNELCLGKAPWRSLPPSPGEGASCHPPSLPPGPPALMAWMCPGGGISGARGLPGSPKSVVTLLRRRNPGRLAEGRGCRFDSLSAHQSSLTLSPGGFTLHQQVHKGGDPVPSVRVASGTGFVCCDAKCVTGGWGVDSSMLGRASSSLLISSCTR